MLQAITTLAQDYTYYTYTTPTADSGGWGAFLVGYSIFFAIFLIPTIAGLWKMFQKAGKPGWAALIPIYNFIVYLQIVGRPVWWLLFLLLGFIPFVGIIVGIILANDMAKSFGKDVGYTVLLFLVPFVGYPILGFGSAQYKGPAALGTPAGGAPGAGPTHPTQHPQA